MSLNKNVLNVAVVQMQSGQDICLNLEQAIACLEEAVSTRKAQLILFPENFLCLGVDCYYSRASEFQAAIKVLTEKASEHSVFLLLGSIPFPTENGLCYSRSLLINPQGHLTGQYDKCHLFDVAVSDNQGNYLESAKFKAGSTAYVAPVFNHSLGLSICYDLRFPELYQALCTQGADMIAVPSAFTYHTGKSHWEILLRARAIETQCFILAPNQCGTHLLEKSGTQRSTWGHSMIVDPWGNILAQLEDAPGICAAELDFDQLKSVRSAMDLRAHKMNSQFRSD